MAFILLLVVALGTFVPCCSADDCTAEEIGAGGTQQDQPGACSPFSSCTTCSAFTLQHTPVLVPEPLQLALQHKGKESTAELPDGFSFFWQPPRIG